MSRSCCYRSQARDSALGTKGGLLFVILVKSKALHRGKKEAIYMRVPSIRGHVTMTKTYWKVSRFVHNERPKEITELSAHYPHLDLFQNWEIDCYKS